uniref:Amiloride-sensitive sodium channel n=1 Tax=Caenorhabditis tropicalis TaxID=1561998 RepID=A0A1I7V382_9PELO
MIKSYSAQPSFMRINETKNHRFSSDIELCSKEKIVCDEILKEKETMTCKEVDAHCVLIRFSTKTKIRLKKKDFPCQPACHEIQYKISNSKLYHNSESVAISFSVLPVITHMQETRKTTLVDILCYLGGASSLFMGCSCVTLMEMFVFLFKLVANSVWSKEAPEPDDSYYEEKYRFEFSDHRNKRRYAICDRETMEKYLLSTNSMEVKSINLDKRLSVFSHSAIRKAPKLKALKDNRNFEHIDIFDEVMESDSMKEEIRTIPKDEYSVEYQDERMDTLGEIPNEQKRSIRPPLRRCSTATSYASHTSKGSSSLTARSFVPIQHNRRMSRAFTRNMPMNDF